MRLTFLHAIAVSSLLLFASPTMASSEAKTDSGQKTASQKTAHAKSSHKSGHGGGHKDLLGQTDTNEKPEEFKLDMAIYTLIVFVLLMLLLRVFAWGPITDGLDKRETKVAEDIAVAENGRKQVEQLIAEHTAKMAAVQDEVHEIIAAARKDAEHVKQEIVESAQRDAEDIKKRSLNEIEQAKNAALNELFSTISSQVADATEHVLGRSLVEGDRDRLIDEALAQLSQNS